MKFWVKSISRAETGTENKRRVAVAWDNFNKSRGLGSPGYFKKNHECKKCKKKDERLYKIFKLVRDRETLTSWENLHLFIGELICMGCMTSFEKSNFYIKEK